MLCDSIENENAFEMEDCWELSPEYIEAKKDLEGLYDWWQERKYVEFINHEDVPQYAEDTKMLSLLLELRRYLCTV
jgi:hypothetical protein